MSRQWSEQWDTPGVRLAETDSESPPTSEAPSAVPVWVGWIDEETACGNQHLIRQPVRLTTVDDWPWKTQDLRYQQAPLYQSVRHYFDNGGDLCYVYVLHVSSETLSAEMAKDLMKALGDPQTYGPLISEPDITLVAVPQLVGLMQRLSAAGGSIGSFSPADGSIRPVMLDEVARSWVDLWRDLLNACQARPDWFFVLDAPRDMTLAQRCLDLLRTTQPLGERGQHAALYGPHLVTNYRDKTEGAAEQMLVLPPSSAVLGMMARADRERGVWSAPANEALAQVLRPEYRESGARQWFDVSQPSINLIRSFPGRGVRVWGCRTLAPATAGPFRYVQVRRLLTYVETSLTRLCRFAVFEPNGPMTWFKLKSVAGAWLHELWRLGGLAGAREEQAFEVLAGLGESMTADDVKAGRLFVKIRLAVLLAAEFIEIQLRFDQQALTEQVATDQAS